MRGDDRRKGTEKKQVAGVIKSKYLGVANLTGSIRKHQISDFLGFFNEP
jgi:hypothetical protein